VLLAENETELQNMLSFVNDWCIAYGMFVNASKKVMLCTLNQISFNIPISFLTVVINYVIEYSNKYMYLGILLTKHLD
jgi:hypothetical protein